MIEPDAEAWYDILINPPQDINCAFPAYLFNEPIHLRQQPCQRFTTFYLFHKRRKRAEARFSFFVQDGKAVSPCRATFGSIEIHPSLPQQALDFFIQTINQYAVNRGVTEIHIKSYPFCYAPEPATHLTASLTREGYQISLTELNYHIPITLTPFESLLHASEKRRLKKCIGHGFVFAEELDPDLSAIYQMVKDTRLKGGFPISLSYTDFEQLFLRFPGIYQVFTVKDSNRIIALTVTVRINQDILYNFYPADDPEYRHFSPAVLLMKGVYEHGQEQQYSILDLGIATDQGEPNYGLIRFKRFIGGKSSLKLSFIKQIATP
ncbi:GNAT family N-acetyltransferase [Rhodocytophaga rosea]|uniref:GNAT family N-acetyltransferase n=1 Tax=Rhodocytophaga rosea TaxID=2704465 RepID=A0A6C0GF70_9BACT|nr:GNAT family N-acetyltransferase [Rhodocytophaga rosea]QHT66567.1 GNAT family N-acetyltransferase [Rhodocytophaga rosea]